MTFDLSPPQALLCLPGSVRRNYETLVSEPMLLVEQLLLDMKVHSHSTHYLTG